MSTRLVGDVHGNTWNYYQAIKGAQQSIQLGDYGVGFIPANELLQADETIPQHKFFTGNHDNDVEARKLKRYMSSGKLSDEVFVVRGAWSIDRASRTPFYDWWVEEQHTQEELNKLVEEYCKVKPRVVLSHDCPTLAAYYLFFRDPEFSKKNFAPGWMNLNPTNEALQYMWEQHSPEAWYFGHWHHSTSKEMNGTKFKCLGIAETVDVEW